MNDVKILLVDGSIYPAVRADIVNGNFEFDFEDKTCEDLEGIFSVSANLVVIKLLTMDDEIYGVYPGWTKYNGVKLKDGIKTVSLSKAVDVTEQRLIVVEANALKAKVIAEDLKENGVSFKENAVLNASVMVARVNAQKLDDKEALEVKAIYDSWEELVFRGFVALEAGYKFTYQKDLYKTVHENQSFQPEWVPGKGTESIYVRIDEIHLGTLDDPIPAATNMEYVKGKHYIEDGQMYLMNREGMEDGEGIILQFLPSALVGQYFVLIS